MRVLILGATGMLGYSLFSNLLDEKGIEVFGTVRNILGKEKYLEDLSESLVFDVDVSDISQIERAIKQVKPGVVINCIGLIKQQSIAKQHVEAIKINALLPHELARLCDEHGAKMIHFSTDCVFSGEKGGYLEEDKPDASDVYGRSKCLGEVDYGKHLTFRTSIIGHELNSQVSLVDWFLSQSDQVKGFSKAVFSGMPTSYIAKLLVENVLDKPDLSGLYHLSVEPIDKYSLLKKIAKVYKKDIDISESSDFIIDRSLNSQPLRKKIGLVLPSWDELVEYMHTDFVKRYQ
jgi:dTDP-4-dehydrorhamnose reductase